MDVQISRVLDGVRFWLWSIHIVVLRMTQTVLGIMTSIPLSIRGCLRANRLLPRPQPIFASLASLLVQRERFG